MQPAFLGFAAVTPEWSWVVFLLHQSCVVSQWISIWINTEASVALGKTAVIITHLIAFIWSIIDAVRCEVYESLFFFLLLSSLPHSENYLVKWSSSGLVKDIDQLHNLRAVFTVRVSVCYNVCLCTIAHLWYPAIYQAML